MIAKKLFAGAVRPIRLRTASTTAFNRPSSVLAAGAFATSPIASVPAVSASSERPYSLPPIVSETFVPAASGVVPMFYLGRWSGGDGKGGTVPAVIRPEPDD
ncbi:MAG: hypothetical protein FJ335_00640 [Sphingomonadales bacterium]|nr:hypothetical protein [Sphingomonadales bacterium]